MHTFVVGSETANHVADDGAFTFQCFARTNGRPFRNVVVGQNAKIDKSFGSIGNITVRDDLKCQDGGAFLYAPYKVKGDNTCN